MANFAAKMEHQLRFAVLFALLALCFNARAQEEDADDTSAPAALPVYVQVGKTEWQGDSIPEIITPIVYKYDKLVFKNEKKRREYNRLVANVKKLLPIAKLARYTIIETYEYMETLPDKKAREAHIKRVEADLRKKYTPMVKKMSRTQGRLLVKLVDRECNQTGYQIAKAFVGPFKAGIYQGIGLLFGNSLNKHYDPEGDDRMTERVVRLVESGQL